jgi:carbonic anhydrase
MRYLRPALTAALVFATGASLYAATEITPAGALERLKAGNARFVQDAASPLPVDEAKRQLQITGQSPFAMVLSCADSRVPPEVIFNVGLGELFVIRTAGEVTDKAVLASVEYAAEHLHTPLLVVMGHELCGAVTAALGTHAGDASQGPNLDALMASIRPAFDRMAEPADMAHLREAILANVEQVVNDVLTKSAAVRELVGEGKLQLVGAYYELATGRVRFSQPLTAAAAKAVPTKASAESHR